VSLIWTDPKKDPAWYHRPIQRVPPLDVKGFKSANVKPGTLYQPCQTSEPPVRWVGWLFIAGACCLGLFGGWLLIRLVDLIVTAWMAR
jgi:hypothetical protein